MREVMFPSVLLSPPSLVCMPKSCCSRVSVIKHQVTAHSFNTTRAPQQQGQRHIQLRGTVK